MRNKSFLPTLAALFFCSTVSLWAQLSQRRPAVGPGNVIVTPRFGGTILGFDVDQNGTEGLLSESSTSGCGYATETFDQKTGAIIKVLSKGSSCADDEVTRAASSVLPSGSSNMITLSSSTTLKRPINW
jgi:hypothetical protein